MEMMMISNEFSNDFSELLGIFGNILDGTSTPDNVRAIAQETLNLVIHAAADDVINVLDSMIPLLTNKLNFFVHERRQNGPTAFVNMQIALLCGAITVVARKIGPRMQEHADKILPAVHGTLVVPPPREKSILAPTSGNNNADDEQDEENEANTMAGVETVVCISALINTLRDGMWSSLDKFTPFLLNGLRQTEDEDVYTSCLGVIGDIANFYGPRANALVMLEALGLLRDQLWSDETPITIKPDILKCIGDVALFYETNFAEFAPAFLKIVRDLDGIARGVDFSDEETRFNTLRLFEGIAVFCSQMITGSRSNPEPILEFLPWMVRFAQEVGLQFNTSDPELLEAVCALLGDIALCMKNAPSDILQNAQQALGSEPISRLLRGAASFNQVMSVCETAQFAMKQVSKLMNRKR
jgi:hypothetical protein